MALEFSKTDEIMFGDRIIPVIDVLNPQLKYKICIRFDGALELVDNAIVEPYWILDPKFNWKLKEEFNVLTPTEFLDPWRREISFFVGNPAVLNMDMINYFKYQYVDCDLIEEIGKQTSVSNTLFEAITDKRSQSNDRIGYCVRRVRNRMNDLRIQSFHPIDVHSHSDDGWYNQAVLYKKALKNRLVLMGAQNRAVAALAIPELYFEENFNRDTEYFTDFHGKDYVKEFIEHNLAFCEEAKEFYAAKYPQYNYCKECRAIAQHLLGIKED